jgi:hypothetical protein
MTQHLVDRMTPEVGKPDGVYTVKWMSQGRRADLRAL